jgi:hypothetical protein
MSEKELKVSGVFYLEMLGNETEEQAMERFYKLITASGIVANNECCTFEAQEV